jgi:hypothetical protein
MLVPNKPLCQYTNGALQVTLTLRATAVGLLTLFILKYMNNETKQKINDAECQRGAGVPEQN